MRSILLVKTSSLGDVIHNLPVVSDIRRHFPDARIDWLVEENYAPIPSLHPAVHRVIPLGWRRWRGQLGQRETWRIMRRFLARLQETEYDWIIDTQGLIKSAVFARLARGRRAGGWAQGIREPLAARLYDHRVAVDYASHAVDYCRAIAAGTLGHAIDTPPSFGIRGAPLLADWLPQEGYVVLLHAAGHPDKLWPESQWLALGQTLASRGLRAVLPWGSMEEKARSERLAQAIPMACVPPRLDLAQMAGFLSGARLVVGLDTGLTHFAAALERPTVGIYIRPFDVVRASLRGTAPHANLGGAEKPPSADAVFSAALALLDA